jgi:hypothetical protein
MARGTFSISTTWRASRRGRWITEPTVCTKPAKASGANRSRTAASQDILELYFFALYFSILILSSHLSLGLPSSLFPSARLPAPSRSMTNISVANYVVARLRFRTIQILLFPCLRRCRLATIPQVVLLQSSSVE